MNSNQLNHFPMGPCELTKPVRLRRNRTSAADTFYVAPGLDSSWANWLVGLGSHGINQGQSVDMVTAIVISRPSMFQTRDGLGRSLGRERR